MGGPGEVGLDHQVLVDEVGRIGMVGVDAAHPGDDQRDLVNGMGSKEANDRRLAAFPPATPAA